VVIGDLLDAFGSALVAAATIAIRMAEVTVIKHEGPPHRYLIRPAWCGCGQCLSFHDLRDGEELTLDRRSRLLVYPIDLPDGTHLARIGQWIAPV
jgi:hypothetical protein